MRPTCIEGNYSPQGTFCDVWYDFPNNPWLVGSCFQKYYFPKQRNRMTMGRHGHGKLAGSIRNHDHMIIANLDDTAVITTL